MKQFTVAILGCGARGAETYGRLMYGAKDKYKIVSLCDFSEKTLEKYGEIFDVPSQNRFSSEEEFFQEKRAELLVIGTQDADHVRHCVAALEVGYDVLLEKPLTAKREECETLLAAQKKYGGKVLVCHVLRYAPAFMKVKELLDQGSIGRLVAMQAIEQVGYWHYSHSYVRGNWRRSEDTSPMILAKCCHDLDLLQWYAGSKCKSVSSIGDLTFFKEENAPEGAAKRCGECKLEEECPFSAKNVYIKCWNASGCPENLWPYNVVTPVLPITEQALVKALEEGPYGRCVFACDNDVVDHQLTNMTFENGVKATLTMTAFTWGGGRIMKFFGTAGELVLDESLDTIEFKPYGKGKETISLAKLSEGGYGHGGGDWGLVCKLYEVLCGKIAPETSLDASVESHLIGIAAEESRRKGGELISLR